MNESNTTTPDDPLGPCGTGVVVDQQIEHELHTSYLTYALSTIMDRALPDVRDGLKPSQRRILVAMNDLNLSPRAKHRKCAKIAGDTSGNYHPHGESVIYPTLVNMGQNWKMRQLLIDKQGNFGSIDPDPPAAMRYTEARLHRHAVEMLEDLKLDTVDWKANFDETVDEPTVLPSKFPNLLVNGAGGIAVGMATNIPPHNLGEVIDACCAYIEDPNISVDGLMDHVKGPDFPTGAMVMGRAGFRDAYHTGRGAVRVRAVVDIEEVRKDREALIVTEIPFQVNKSRMVERIAEVVRDKTIEGVADLRDESDRHGMRVVVDLRRDAVAEVILAQIYRYTALQSTFGVNMLALDGGRPVLMNLKQILDAFVAFREEVIRRRTVYLLTRARDRAHVLAGLAIAVANIDDVVSLVRAAPDPQVARQQLMDRPWPASDVAPLIELIDEPGHGLDEDGAYRLSEIQAKAILDLRLQRLTGLERDKIAAELHEVCAEISQFLAIPASRETLRGMLRDEILKVQEEFATPRRTEPVESEAEVDIEDLIQREDMVVTVSHGGYIKRVPLSTYRAQRRGGKGRAGMSSQRANTGTVRLRGWRIRTTLAPPQVQPSSPPSPHSRADPSAVARRNSFQLR